jgi:cardiolipin synthase
VVKEGFQLIAGSISLRKGIILKGALLSGKICTTVLFISLILLVMIPDFYPATVKIITVIDMIFMIIAFGDYLLAYFRKESKFQKIHESNE